MGGGNRGIAGGLGSALYGDGGADAAQKAAEEQLAFAKTNYINVKNITDRATAQSILSFEQDIKNQERELSRQEQLVAQIDPAILEASQQALKLLRGETSSALKPMQDQRALQRQQLVNRLREQMGPGAETSTAGIQALNRFDMESNNLFAGQQQSALQLLGGTAAQFAGLRPNINQAIGLRSQYGQGGADSLFRQAQFLNQAFAPVQQSAGAQYTGDVLRGQQDFALSRDLIAAGVKGVTAAATGGKSMG